MSLVVNLIRDALALMGDVAQLFAFGVAIVVCSTIPAGLVVGLWREWREWRR